MLHVCIIAGGDHKLLGILFTLLLSNGFGTFMVQFLTTLHGILQVITVALIGMLLIMYRKYQAHRSSLVKAFYSDGIGFFVGLSGRFPVVVAPSQELNIKLYSLGPSKCRPELRTWGMAESFHLGRFLC
jgi:amino acid transporter